MSESMETADNGTKGTESVPESAKEEKYLIFSILGRQFGFPSRLISEIALFETVYPLPLMPAYVMGVINRYSVPYALFDSGLLLFKTPSPRAKVLVLKDGIDRIAFLIDDVIGIADVQQGELLEVDRGTESDGMAEAITASFSWEDGNVFVLDIQRVLALVTAEVV